MKKYLLKIALFFALMVMIDVACGWAFGLLRSKAKSGRTFQNQYVLTKSKEDILILGSSRAVRHYDPYVIEDSLGMSCYNAGVTGSGIIPAYIRYKMVRERKAPRIVIYEVTPEFDYGIDNGYSSYLGTIRPYCDIKEIHDFYLEFTDGLEPIRLMSKMYCNNSQILQVLKDFFGSEPNRKGYEPLFGKYSPKDTDIQNDSNDFRVDSLKFAYLEQLICETKKDSIDLFFMISPRFHSTFSFNKYSPIFDLCQKHGVPLINNLNGCDNLRSADLFQDDGHLNDNGAIQYSKIVCSQLKQYLNKNNQ